jgi:hypothetical protein
MLGIRLEPSNIRPRDFRKNIIIFPKFAESTREDEAFLDKATTLFQMSSSQGVQRIGKTGMNG